TRRARRWSRPSCMPARRQFRSWTNRCSPTCPVTPTSRRCTPRCTPPTQRSPSRRATPVTSMLLAPGRPPLACSGSGALPWRRRGGPPKSPTPSVVVIEPAMAFGTGEHETTRGVLRLMQDVVRPGDTVIDLGAGSAILSIAAVRLGAGRAIAIESDPQAIENAEQNAAANGVADRVRVIEGDARVILPLVAPARVLFANIISQVVVE